MTRCKSKSYKLSTEFWLNYHLPQVPVSSLLCLILFWSPSEIPPPTRGDGLSPLVVFSLGYGTSPQTGGRWDEVPTPAPQGPRGSKQQFPCYMPHVLKTITNTTIILGVDGKQYRDFSSLKKYVVHLLLQIYFL